MSAPERIYLHGWDPDYPHDASWCADKVDDDDVVYVRLRSAGETEALREAQVERVAEAMYDEYRVGCGTERYQPMWHIVDEGVRKGYRNRARRALDQHVGGEG